MNDLGQFDISVVVPAYNGEAYIAEALSSILAPFAKVKGEREVFEGGREGVKTLLAATQSPSGVSPQDRMIDLLAGTSLPDSSDAHTQLVEDMIRIFESQRLISLADIFGLVDHLEGLAKGEKVNSALVTKTASRIAEIQLPRAPLSGLVDAVFQTGHAKPQGRRRRTAQRLSGQHPEKRPTSHPQLLS